MKFQESRTSIDLHSTFVLVLYLCFCGCEAEADLGSPGPVPDQDPGGSTDVDQEQSTTDERQESDLDSDTGRETTQDSARYDGECREGEECYDVTGDSDFGCLRGGEVPPGAEEQCSAENPCPANSTCYSYLDGSGSVCIQDCFECSPGEDTCNEGEFCDNGFCRPLPCTADSCVAGEICFEGTCIPDIGDGPRANPGIECDLPSPTCDPLVGDCGELVQFNPTAGVGYIDYPENGENADNQYRSWVRRDLKMLIEYAAAKVDCLAKDWRFGNGAPIGLIDMSEENGDIPGTSINQPGHPPGTHVGGHDIDVAYYQAGVPDNRARPICDHHQGGADAYHCTASPHLLDPWRQALFIGALFESPGLRVVGCDGRAGPMLEMARSKICDLGWLPEEACLVNKLAYEVEDQGYGWYRFHHHHIHVSFSGTGTTQNLMVETSDLMPVFPIDEKQCLIPGCRDGRLGFGGWHDYRRRSPVLRLPAR